MIYREIQLQPDYRAVNACHSGADPKLSIYLPEHRGSRAGQAVLILPGGGYHITSWREGEPVALEFVRRGIAAFVLWYSVEPNRYPCQHLEVGFCIRMIAEHCAEWNVDPDRLYLLGFSAGGHLAATYATLYRELPLPDAPGGRERYRVAGTILAYPVITASGKYAHGDSIRKITGGDPELMKLLSAEKHVIADTPRMFLWHTAADRGVPAQNSLMMASALAEAGVPYELHVYETGRHGLSLGNSIVEALPGECGDRHRRWADDVCEWMEGQ